MTAAIQETLHDATVGSSPLSKIAGDNLAKKSHTETMSPAWSVASTLASTLTPEPSLETCASKLSLPKTWTWFGHLCPKQGSKYEDHTIVVPVEIDTVQRFWQVFNALPGPLQFGATQKAYSFFEKGCLPKWEHANNVAGCHYFCHFPISQQFLLNDSWKCLLLDLIGAQLTFRVNGVRVVSAKNAYRFEVWFPDVEPAQKTWLNHRFASFFVHASANSVPSVLKLEFTGPILHQD